MVDDIFSTRHRIADGGKVLGAVRGSMVLDTCRGVMAQGLTTAVRDDVLWD